MVTPDSLHSVEVNMTPAARRRLLLRERLRRLQDVLRHIDHCQQCQRTRGGRAGVQVVELALECPEVAEAWSRWLELKAVLVIEGLEVA